MLFDFWWQLALAQPTLVWLICKAAVVESYQRGIEDATRGAFGYSYFDTEHWLIGQHVNLRERLETDNGLDYEDALRKLKVEVEAKLAPPPGLLDGETEALSLTRAGREQLRLQNEESAELTRRLTRHKRTGRWN